MRSPPRHKARTPIHATEQAKKRGFARLSPNPDKLPAIEQRLHQTHVKPPEEVQICHLPEIAPDLAAVPRSGRRQHMVPGTRKPLRPVPRAKPIRRVARHPDRARRRCDGPGDIELRKKLALPRDGPTVPARAQRDRMKERRAAAEAMHGGFGAAGHPRAWSGFLRCRKERS